MVHPRDAEVWEWDEANEAELAAHGVDPEEVHELWQNGPVWVPNRRRRTGDWKMLGTTVGGRRLTIVMRYYQDSRTLRAITGWEATNDEQSKYF